MATKASQDALKGHLNGRIRETLKEHTGPSFEERSRMAAKEFRMRAQAMEREQQKVLDEALERAKLRPCSSAVRPKEMIPPTPEERALHHAQVIKKNNARYAKEKADREKRIKSREPLYKVSEVKAAFEEQERRQRERKKQLREEERLQWEHIQELKERVVERPLLVEEYHRPEHTRTVENPRLVPEHSKPTLLEAQLHKALSAPDLADYRLAIKQRQDVRPKLHEIQYPPKKFVYKPREKVMSDMDKRLEELVQADWYKRSGWASQVAEIRQRQDDRPKLHEIAYPPKTG